MHARAHRARTGHMILAAFLLLAFVPGWWSPAAGQPATPPAGDCVVSTEPNDQPADAIVLPEGASCVTATSAGPAQDLYRWTVTDAEAGQRWSVGLSSVADQVTRLEVYTVELDDAGEVVTATRLLSTVGEPDQPLSLDDLLWALGTYYIAVATSGPGSYALTVAAGAAIPDTAGPDGETSGAFERAAAADGAVSWTLDDADAATRWTVTLQGAVWRSLTLTIADADGTTMLTAPVGEDGLAIVPDVGFAAGTYSLSVSGTGDDGVPWVLSAMAAGERVSGEEDEPNDAAAAAMPLAFDGDTATISGRLAMVGPADRADRDLYHLNVDTAHAGRFIDIRLLWRGEAERDLCLLDDAENELKCATGSGGVALNDLVLATGDYLVAVSGRPNPDESYLVRVEVTGEAVSGFETEPNDDFSQPSALAPVGDGFEGSGRLSQTDTDYLHTTISGEPQLWLIELEVMGAVGFDLLDSTGGTLMRGAPVDGGLAIVDAYLVPGDHAFWVSGTDADYHLTMTPLGPPDPAHEREPNDTVDRSQPLHLLEQRTGRLPTTPDNDIYRFSLEDTTYLDVRVDVPADGMFSMTLSWREQTVATRASVEAGEPLDIAGWLEPGDYTVRLQAATPSEDNYAIALTPLDPFQLPADLEPNDDFSQARIAPDSHHVVGIGDHTNGYGVDIDWYTIAPFDTGIDANLAYTPEMTVELFASGQPGSEPEALVLLPGTEPGEATASIPADRPILLKVTGIGPYEVALWPVGEQAPVATPVADSPGLALALELDEDPVAAYWSTGQRIEGELTIENEGQASGEVRLDARTGNARWRVEFDQDTVALNSGETAVVPVTVHIAPDARAGAPVFVAVRATSPSAEASVMTLLTPDRVAVPAQVEPWWPLPESLLGGVNVAWSALGAAPVAADEVTAAAEAPLYDGMTTTGSGWKADALALPVELTVDLAEDELVPVAGFTIFPAGTDQGAGSQVRDYELALSTDGVSFTTVATGSLQPVATEQPVTLDEPVEARFAKLRVLSTVNPTASTVTLGEWTVIADPGWSPGPGFDLASPELGGHIVDMQPPLPYPRDADHLLTPDEVPQLIDAPPGSTVSWIVGFQHDRAAQVSALSWIDPPGSDPARQVERLQVEASTGSPLGPWMSLGEWELARDGSGTATLELDEPVWARFIRFTGVVPASDGDTVEMELPDVIRVVERPMDETYRSIAGEWGGDRREASLELTDPGDLPALDADAGNDASAATVLPVGATRTDVAANGVDEDWYRIEMPAGMSELELTITGYPAIGVTAELFDSTGGMIPVATSQVDANEMRIAASVDPGGRYLLQVTQPPTSVVIAFDSSLSIGPLEPAVYQGLSRFATDVQPGREFVQVLPFGEELLLPAWSDDPYEIQGAIAGYPRTAVSSDAEGAILSSTDAFQDRPGTRALMLITDGESEPSQEQMEKLWPSLAATGPRIFAVGIAGSDDAARGQDVMQDWSTVGGQYVYVRDQGAMDVAFDRAATELRRPAVYSVLATASAAPPTPTPAPAPTATPSPVPTAVPENGTLTVVAPSSDAGVPVVVSTQGQVAIILDTSGSMLQPLGGGTRADVAKSALTDLVTTTIPPGTVVSLRTFGDTPDSCQTLLAVPPGPLDPAAMSATIAGLPVINLVRTPIGAALEATMGDMVGDGPRIVVLVTDGEETCDGDPAAAIQAMVDSGIDVRVNIVGFAIDDPALAATFEDWARLGNGRYIDAGNAAELNRAVAEAVLPAFDVVDANGAVVAGGQVGGEPVSLPPGSYTVVVHTNPDTTLEAVVSPGEATTVALPPVP